VASTVLHTERCPVFRLCLPLFLAAVACFASGPTQAQRADHPSVRPFIIGGSAANIADFPYQVALNLTRNGSTSLCGGSIIAPKWILTAAHCFVSGSTAYLDPADVEIKTGANGLYSTDMTITGASKVVVNEDYDGAAGTHENDIALIQTSTPLIGAPVALNSQANLSGDAIVTGWGRTSADVPVSSTAVLMKATLPLVSNDTCNQPVSYNGRITADMLCAGFSQGGVDHCYGDSGGPLVQSRATPQGGTEKVQIGVISWAAEGCAQPEKYGVYTRISAYLDWIGTAIVQAEHPSLSVEQAGLFANASRNSRGLPDPDRVQRLIAGLNHSPRAGSQSLNPNVPPETSGRGTVMEAYRLRGRLSSFASDSWHDVILLNDGTVFTLYYLMPQYTFGRQGLGVPAGLTDVVAVGALDGWSYALKRDGTVIKWNSKAIDLKNEDEARNCHPDC
jgi:trypsin